MAGGGGTRFWPLSRQAMPKQFLNLTGNDIMLNETMNRLEGMIRTDDIFVVTNEAYTELTKDKTKGKMREDHILSEPAARNTAACIGYAAMEIMRKYGDGVMCILASDHYIENLGEYQKVMREAVEIASKSKKLVTIGIGPTFPSTGYGYIRYRAAKDCNYHEVEEFVEKPCVESAKEYIERGNYLWNSGMFVWKASVILEQFEKLLPDIYECLLTIGASMNTAEEKEVIQRVYPMIPKISIDYGIMERAKEVVVLEGNFGWNDIGSFDSFQAICKPDGNGNILYGENVNVDTRNCISYAQNKLIATVGVENLIIVETEDAVFVCDRDRAQEVRSIVEELQRTNKNQYL